MARLTEAKAAVEAARDRGGALPAPAPVRERLEAAEAGFLDLASALLRAPDPVPLLRGHAALLQTYAGAGTAPTPAMSILSHSCDRCCPPLQAILIEQPINASPLADFQPPLISATAGGRTARFKSPH